MQFLLAVLLLLLTAPALAQTPDAVRAAFLKTIDRARVPLEPARG